MRPEEKPSAASGVDPVQEQRIDWSRTVQLAKDVRFWIWPLMVGLACFLSRDWVPTAVLWESRSGAPPSVIVVKTVEGLMWPGTLMIAALVGLARAWSGRLALNGAYFFGCLFVVLVSGFLSWERMTYRLSVNAREATVRQHGFYYRTFERGEIVRISTHKTARRGLVRLSPQLELANGTRVVIAGTLAWEWAERLSALWGVPEEEVP